MLTALIINSSSRFRFLVLVVSSLFCTGSSLNRHDEPVFQLIFPDTMFSYNFDSFFLLGQTSPTTSYSTQLDEDFEVDSFVCYILVKYASELTLKEPLGTNNYFSLEKNNFGSISFLFKQQSQVYYRPSVINLYSLKLARRLDRELYQDYQLSLIASVGNRTSQVTLNVKVNDVNDNRPEFVDKNYYFELDENVENKCFGSVRAVDPDNGPNGTVEYFMYSLPNEQALTYQGLSIDEIVSLNSRTGQLCVKKAVDRELVSKLVFKIGARDKGLPYSLPAIQPTTVNVRIRDVNDHRPQFYPNQGDFFYMEENQAAGSYMIAWLKAFDMDVESDHNRVYYMWRLQGPSRSIPFNFTNKMFTIDSNGVLRNGCKFRLMSAESRNGEYMYDQDENTLYTRSGLLSLRVTIHDDLNLSKALTRSINITIRLIPSVPTIEHEANSTLELHSNNPVMVYNIDNLLSSLRLLDLVRNKSDVTPGGDQPLVYQIIPSDTELNDDKIKFCDQIKVLDYFYISKATSNKSSLYVYNSSGILNDSVAACFVNIRITSRHFKINHDHLVLFGNNKSLNASDVYQVRDKANRRNRNNGILNMSIGSSSSTEPKEFLYKKIYALSLVAGLVIGFLVCTIILTRCILNRLLKRVKKDPIEIKKPRLNDKNTASKNYKLFLSNIKRKSSSLLKPGRPGGAVKNQKTLQVNDFCDKNGRLNDHLKPQTSHILSSGGDSSSNSSSCSDTSGELINTKKLFFGIYNVSDQILIDYDDETRPIGPIISNKASEFEYKKEKSASGYVAGSRLNEKSQREKELQLEKSLLNVNRLVAAKSSNLNSLV